MQVFAVWARALVEAHVCLAERAVPVDQQCQLVQKTLTLLVHALTTSKAATGGIVGSLGRCAKCVLRPLIQCERNASQISQLKSLAVDEGRSMLSAYLAELTAVLTLSNVHAWPAVFDVLDDFMKNVGRDVAQLNTLKATIGALLDLHDTELDTAAHRSATEKVDHIVCRPHQCNSCRSSAQ